MVKLGDERHIFDRAELVYTEVREIEKVTGVELRRVGTRARQVLDHGSGYALPSPWHPWVMTIPRPPKGAGPLPRRSRPSA